MIKRRTLFIGGIILLLGALWYTKYYLLDQSVVTFQLISSLHQVDLYTKNDTKVGSITGNENVRLPHGDYYAVPASGDYSNSHISFSSPSNTTVLIDPDYSLNKLSLLATKALTNIHTLFEQRYPALMADYSVQSFTLYKKGQWGGGLLVRNDSTQNDTKDMYRFVVRYSSNWQIINYPDLILTQAAYTDTPADILHAIDILDYSLPNA